MGIDVITAVHAPHARYIAHAWESLRRQSYRTWTWQVQIDGPSADVRTALHACGAEGDSRVHVAENGTAEGPAVTRNVALGRSTAELVQNLDADDELEPDALTTLHDVLRSHTRASYAVALARDLLPDGSLVEHPSPLAAGVIPPGRVAAAWQTDGSLPVHPAGILWRRELLVRLGGWAALRGMEDTGLLIAASTVSAGVFVDRPLLRYRKHPEQETAKDPEFNGGGAQLAFIRQRAAALSSWPS